MSQSNSRIDQTPKQQAYIFGAGKAGESAFAQLKTEYDILGFVDNDETKQGNKLLGLSIFSISVLANDEAVILIASEFFEQIKAQLLTLPYIDNSRVKTIPARCLKPMAFTQEAEVLGLNILRVICERLESGAIDYHIDAGTLLGLYRDGQLIPWDDDLDIAVNAESVQSLTTLLSKLTIELESLTSASWQFDSLKTDHQFGNVPKGVVRSFKLYATQGDKIPSVDFFVKYVDATHSDYCLASRGIRMPANYMKQTKLTEVAGQHWRFPADPEGYLACHYGEDWHVPKPDWSLQDLNNSKVFDA